MMHSQVPTAAPAVRKPDLVTDRPQARAPIYHQIADFLLSLLPSGRPRRLARMSKPGETKDEILRDEKTKKPIRNEHGKVIKTGRMIPRDKYEDISANQLTVAMLRNHARGVNTYSYTIDKNGSARFGVSDVDEGGQPALLALLRAADTLGISAFAIENTKGGKHKGGHLICLFNGEYPAADIEALLRTIHQAAGIPATELWPGCNQGIRGLFGVHQLDQTRGVLLLQSGEIINLDTDLATGFAAVRDLPTNSAPPPAPAVERPQSAPKAPPARLLNLTTAQPRQRTSAGRIDTKAIGDAVRARFNQEHEWSDLLSAAGGTEMRTGYWACNCGVAHTHDIQIAVTSRDKIIGLSDRCGWVGKENALDKFGFEINQKFNGNYKAAVQFWARHYGLWVELKQRQETPPPAEPARRQQTPAQAADAARKRQERSDEAAQIRADVERRASQDARLSDAGQLVLLGLLDIAGDRAWCRPSVARLEALIAMKRRSVFYGLAELEQYGYIRSSKVPGRTTVRTFLRVQADQPENGALHPDLIASNTQVESIDLVRGGHQPTQATAEPPRATQPDMPLTAPEAATAGLEAPSGPHAEYRPEWSILSNDKPYTGRHCINIEMRWALSNESIKLRTDDAGDVADVAEQVMLDSAPPPARKPTRRRSEISALDRYRVDVAMMQPARLAGEVKKHLATLKKHAGAVWLDQVREKLAIVEAALAENRPQSKTTVPVSPPLTSYHASIVPSTPIIQQGFL